MSATLKNVAVSEGHTDRVWSLSWSPSGSLLASCGGDKTIRLWKLKDDNSLECIHTCIDTHERTIRHVCWSPSGQYLAAASFDSTASVWKKVNNNGEIALEMLARLEGHENEVKSVSWDASGSLLATCSRDKSVWIWDMDEDEEFNCVAVLHGHSQDVKAVKWHPSKEILFSSSYDDTIKAWEDDEDDWYCSHTLTGHTSTVWDVSFNSDGSKMVSCSDDNNLIIWDTKVIGDGPKQVCTLSGYHTRTIFSVDWSEEGYIASAGADDSIHIFREDGPGDSSEDKKVSFSQTSVERKAHGGDVNCVTWRPAKREDGTILLASCGDDNLIKLWALEISSDVQIMVKFRFQKPPYMIMVTAIHMVEVLWLSNHC
ncbi:hypothetical protein PROFUN_05928 [Planoprotostelium fungivorum]|uniref:Probable cytosolic iron-sulfur protein assembly protein CIAO1 homolog n=1 Tax=Planoprotostelium fungivorum TaxID=1890364 RepID=A0A2P6N7M0_9EUKA|nr:hypothetical protein PROFUN_05928 [Planoprotostelium fungivorum]